MTASLAVDQCFLVDGFNPEVSAARLTFTQVVETSVTNNSSPSQSVPHSDDRAAQKNNNLFLHFSVADFSKCARSFSVLFVAFDFEEWEDCSNTTLNPRCACGQIDCGSRAFVANFSRFYNGSLHSHGKLQGAIIMDTVMNYNSTPNTQILPPSIEKVLPEIYHQIKEDKFQGNFLSVAGRLVDDAALMDSFWYHYNQVKSGENLDFGSNRPLCARKSVNYILAVLFSPFVTYY